MAGVRDDSSDDTAFEMEVFVDGVSKFTGNVALGQTALLNISLADGLRLRVEARPDTTDDFNGRAVGADVHARTTNSCS